MNQSGPERDDNSRKQRLIVAIAVLLFVAAMITAVVWALVLEQQRRKPTIPTSTRSEPTGELRIYGGLPNCAGYGHPVIVLTNIGYLTGYCEARRNPAWVSFSVSSITLGALGKRPSKFFADGRTRSATHQDYSNSGYDRGHMAPNYAIGTRYGQEAQRETFLMSNIVPQTKALNQIWWRALEEKEANDFAVRLERVWVVTGPVFDQRIERLASGVEIPDAFYRIILDEENGQPRVLAFLAPQTITGKEPLGQFLTSVREIERQTSLDFYPELPKEVQDRIEMPRADRLW